MAISRTFASGAFYSVQQKREEVGQFKRVHNDDVATIVVRMLARKMTALLNK